MIYTESFRHFVQEWICVDPPNKFPDWPWGRKKVWLLNLYTVSSPEVLYKRPAPFISILLDDSDVTGLIDPDKHTAYKGYFSHQFCFPRKYLFNPEGNSDCVFKTNRYSYTSDGGTRQLENWKTEDMKLLSLLASKPHVRRWYLSSKVYGVLLKRLEHFSRKFEFQYQTAENLLDCTFVAVDQLNRFSSKPPQTMLIQAPITGMLSPIRKTRDYRLINGALSIGGEEVLLAIPGEPSMSEYDVERIPFKNLARSKNAPSYGTFENTKTVVYAVVESHNAVFSFQEYFPKMKITANGVTYARLVDHKFMIRPCLNGDNVEIRLFHDVSEGIIPDTKENFYFLRKKPHENLFSRTDMPSGFTKTPDGDVVSQLF